MDQWTVTAQEQYHFVSLVPRRIPLAVSRIRGNVKEVSGTRQYGVFTITILEANLTGDCISVDVVISVVVPTRLDPGLGTGAQHPVALAVESKSPGDARCRGRL
jgi:hypothetical protein